MERAAPKLLSGRARSTRRGVTSASEAPAAETTKRRRHGGTHLWYGFALLLVFGALQVYILVQSHTHSGLNVQAYLRTLFVARRPPSSPVVTVPSLPPSQADSPDSEEGEAEEQAKGEESRPPASEESRPPASPGLEPWHEYDSKSRANRADSRLLTRERMASSLVAVETRGLAAATGAATRGCWAAPVPVPVHAHVPMHEHAHVYHVHVYHAHV